MKSEIYKLLRLHSDIKAVFTGKILQRLFNKAWGRITSKGYMRK